MPTGRPQRLLLAAMVRSFLLLRQLPLLLLPRQLLLQPPFQLLLLLWSQRLWLLKR